VAVLIDRPAWPAHGRLWSHLVSDGSFAELHAFAAAQGVPRRRFERDHYDVPADAYDALVAAGAQPVSSREVVRRLVAAGLRRRKADSMARREPGAVLLRPRRLERGDLVAVPATSGVVPAPMLRAGVARLESWGLRVGLDHHVLDRDTRLSYLSAADDVRAAAFTDAWLNPDASAVIVARGGYGSQRVVDLVDWRRLAGAEPKVLVGFSDATALHQAVAGRLGLATVHSHSVASLGAATTESAEALRRLLMEPATVTDLLADQTSETVVGGRGRGVLVGGNLALLASDLGTPFARSAAGGIALLEDTGEAAYRVDRLLTQLLRAGWFEGARGLVLGAFTDCDDPVELDVVLQARLAPLGLPTVRHVDVGHTSSSATVPLGVEAVLDADAGSLALTRSALV